MSAALSTDIPAADLARLERDLNDMLLAGQLLDAFEKYYAQDVVMQENAEPPTVGKDANREREEQFVGSVETFHGGSVGNIAIGDDVTFSEWTMDVTFQGGQRVELAQVAVRRWKDGLIVHERFYHG